MTTVTPTGVKGDVKDLSLAPHGKARIEWAGAGDAGPRG